MRRPGVRVKPIGSLSLNRMIPNILTLLALCAGMTAMRFALSNKYESATVAIMLAAVLDGVDGRIARLLKGTSPFGAQLDSLSDFVSFGAAPAVMLYLWTMQDLKSFGWPVVLLFAVCSAMRLARFNAQIGAELPPYAYNFFTGVPAPAAAMLVMIPMFLTFEFGDGLFRSPYLSGIVVAGVAALMVSRVPTFSFKRVHLPIEWWPPVLLLTVGLVAFMTTEPWATLLAVEALYIASIPLSIRSYRRLRRAAEALRSGVPHEEIEAADHPGL
ncbi:MAG TPA: CDP-diacylglycerol--serine O-phosphatidyltransferase [Stellaceae bacterium]|jgi:CDP-diacylglycerol--serine O-phosphatidyltransferase|nr:CDP-diacylglycerol--serine O-phosphatidyltransferase [Stellaceae bacterium]